MFSLLVFLVRQSWVQANLHSWVQANLHSLLLNYLTITFSKSHSLLVPNLQLFMQRKKERLSSIMFSSCRKTDQVKVGWPCLSSKFLSNPKFFSTWTSKKLTFQNHHPPCCLHLNSPQLANTRPAGWLLPCNSAWFLVRILTREEKKKSVLRLLIISFSPLSAFFTC